MDTKPQEIGEVVTNALTNSTFGVHSIPDAGFMLLSFKEGNRIKSLVYIDDPEKFKNVIRSMIKSGRTVWPKEFSEEEFVKAENPNKVHLFRFNQKITLYLQTVDGFDRNTFDISIDEIPELIKNLQAAWDGTR